MPEQDRKPATTKFLSSLVQFLQILCNDRVKFTESIELVGHIYVRVDHKYKLDYILDEKVSKEDGNTNNTFLSNSYHPYPPSGQANKKSDPDVIFSKLYQNVQDITEQAKTNHDCKTQAHSFHPVESRQEVNRNYLVTIGSADKPASQTGVNSEGSYDSNVCMFLSTSLVSDDFEPVLGGNGSFQTASPSVLFEEAPQSQVKHTRKYQQSNEQGTLEEANSVRSSEKGMQLRSSTSQLKPAPRIMDDKNAKDNKNSQNEKQLLVPSGPGSDMKCLVSKLAALCDMTLVQEDLVVAASKNAIVPTNEYTKSFTQLFLQTFGMEKFKKINKILKMKKSKQKEQQLRSLLAESGLSNEQLLLLAQDTNSQMKKVNLRSIPEGPGKQAVLKEHRKTLRLTTHERRQRLLEMTKMLKRRQMNDPGDTIVSKTGGKKCVLHRSSVSGLSHNTQQLSVENIDELSEALSGKTKKTCGQSSCQNKPKDQLKVEYSRRICIKKKMKQIIGNILGEVNDAGYCVIVTSTIGSESGSHNAELSIVPMKVDNFTPEVKVSGVGTELSDEECAKELEREQILEKHQFSQEKIKEFESKLLRVLTGTEEISVPTRKRYRKGEPRPSDAERMKEYRKRLKQDPEKYQMYRQKRAMNKKKHRLGELAAKVKNLGPIVTSVPKDSHGPQALVSMTQPLSSVTMHCPQVYEHPDSHQSTSSLVHVHHTSQYVGQMSAIHGSHQHQEPVTFGNEIDIVELIAATHNVQNQHFS